jgi:hypothetical protein
MISIYKEAIIPIKLHDFLSLLSKLHTRARVANLGLDQIYLPCPLSELFLPPFCNQSTHAEFTSSTKSETATIGEPCPLWPVAAKAWTTPLVVDVDVVPSRFPPFVSQLPKAQGLIHMSMISSPRPSWSHFDPHKLPTGAPDFERGEQIHIRRSYWETCEARHTFFGRLDAIKLSQEAKCVRQHTKVSHLSAC